MRPFRLSAMTSALALAGLVLAAPAMATIFITDYSVTATYAATGGLPFSSLSATYTLTYDSSISAQANAISLTAFSMDLNGVHYDLGNVGKQFLPPTTNPKTLQIGANLNGAFALAAGTNDFLFTFAYLPDYTNTASGGAFPSPSFQVSAVGATGIRSATSLVVTRLATAPEPAAWALMVAGFAMTGGALRRRRLPALA